MGYNIVANNGEQLQLFYEWSTDEGVYVDCVHHQCGMWWHHVKSSFAIRCCMPLHLYD
jgi:hypothetical protein